MFYINLNTKSKQISILQIISLNKKMNSCLIILLIFALLCNVNTVDEGDWVDTDLLKQIVGSMVNPYFAGYLNLSSTQAYYYTYFPSQNNPGKDPLIVRISAGPGCSALYSAYYSKGPFIFVKNTKSFRENPYKWNKQANLLFIEGPAGVGFSTGKDSSYEDQRSAMEFYFAIEKFYEKFPELKDQSMYLSGQQYAGIIVPRMAELIVRLNRNPDTPAWQKIKLAGFILNNPCTQGDECDSHFQFTSYTMRFLRNHYFISNQQYQEYATHCSIPNSQCQAIKQSIEGHFLNTGADLRNLYSECVNQQGDMKCFDQVGILNFLNNPVVKNIIHAETSITWKMCNFDIQKSWARDPQGSIKIYERLLTEERDLRIWIISGTLSGVIPALGTKKWFNQVKISAGLPLVRLWEPWFYNGTINAGDIQQARGITFATVRSGGYYLWNDQPEIGYHVIDSFLKGTPL